MRLTQLKLSGFKSFAKSTTLEFTHPITAIVGPNGSGKSNIAEGVRWVLGEQSLKSLRGKKGEDLIFNGSESSSRMGKASAKLVFNNRDGKIPLEFEEVVFERKIFRDGTNEYYLNGSHVRLKDIVELLARIGLGETKHNIIGQGEVDRLLLSSGRERREMLEEAMGLKVYQLKKTEAERKLEETSENTLQAQAILKEIAPHLKFLKLQAEKAENRELVLKGLSDSQCAWIIASRKQFADDLARLREEHRPAEAKLVSIEKEIELLEKNIGAFESALVTSRGSSDSAKDIETAETECQKLLLELGRIEGKLERKIESMPKTTKTVEAGYIRARLTSLLDHLEEIQLIDDLEEVREKIHSLISDIETLLAEIEEHSIERRTEPDDGERKGLEELQHRVREKLSALQKEIAEMRAAREKESEEISELQETLRKHERMLREKEEERGDLRSALQRWFFDKERLETEEGQLDEEMTQSKISQEDIRAFDFVPFSSFSVAELKKRVDRYRVKLEEIGGIDPAVVKEYQETKNRYDFLEKEISDLESASRNLRLLIKELEETMERDFETGFNKIKQEFNNYFRIIFGGGKGILKYVPLRERQTDEETEETDGGKEREYGIEIDVDVPRKRIQSLAMLSGGERALTSIALLFAITAVNPPPFLLLDETDAALDEANSQKHAAILRELSKKTQLLIITHNRETMKQAGVLYGVTMGGDGVSKLLSLKMEEAAAYTNR